MEVVYYTLVGGGLYLAADWVLNFIENSRGARFENRVVRALVFFIIILVMAFVAFGLVNYLMNPAFE